MSDSQALIDTRDMVGIHNTFRRALGDAPAQIRAVPDGDHARAEQLGSYLGEVLWLLQAHHEGEDELLYPLLEQRVPEEAELFQRMEAQHASVHVSLEAAKAAAGQFRATGSLADGELAADACQALLAATDGHLSEEEQLVLPLAARAISPPEWGAMPAHALSQYRGDRVWLPFGLAFESMPKDIQDTMLAHLPPPVVAMWSGGGSDAFANEMAQIRAGS
ncbi:MAG TPA: hemerythrin domain-containing protein [Acidimicrobiales bacterium]|nr:hemerythrin domain-containing protein [Acidimicrobiales bacterium]